MQFTASNDGALHDVITKRWERIQILLPKEASFSSSLSFSSSSLPTFFTLPLPCNLEIYMAAHIAATAAALFLLIYCVAAAAASPVSDGRRRNLHEPLYPIQWTPPTPPSDDTYPFPESPAPPVPFSSDSPSSPDTATQSAASVGAPNPTYHSLSGSTKVVIGVSASVCAVVIISISSCFLYRRRARGQPESRKLIADSSHFAAPDRPVPVADFLYIGTMEPTVPVSQRLSAEENGSPYHKLSAEIERIVEVRHPSPELHPLPPLVGLGRRRDAPPLPPPLKSAEMATTERAASSDDDTYYTSKVSVASRNSESPVTPTSRRSQPTSAARDLPRSRRSSPRLQLSEYSPSDIKRTVSSNYPPPPPPPPPPLPAPPKTEGIILPPPSSIKRPAFGRINHEYHEVPPSPVPSWTSSRRQLLRPLPPEDAVRANLRAPIPPLVNDGCTSSSQLVNEARDDFLSEGKPKLNPLHWDKVQASYDREIVWDQLKPDSFQLNEDMIETLFVVNSTNPPPKEQNRRAVLLPPLKQEHRVLDPKKSQNIAILLRALNVTREEVSEALLDGNAEGLGAELFETLMKMAPTKEEELKLSDYNGDASKLGSAERFLKAVLGIPYAFKRVDVMLYRANFEAEVKYLRSSFETFEAACEDLRNSKLFLKLLEAVLRTGNRMNIGTNCSVAKAFKLDTLLKLAEVKGADRKTTVLHFVVHDIILPEGSSSETAGENQPSLKVVAGLSSELVNVKRAACMDSVVLHSYLSKLELGLENIQSVLQLKDSCEQGQKFFDSSRTFLLEAEQEIERVKTEEKKALHRIRELTEYFHGDALKEEAHPLKIFVMVRDFLTVLDHVCKDVGRLQERATVSSGKSFRVSESLSLPVLHRYVPKPTPTSDEAISSP